MNSYITSSVRIATVLTGSIAALGGLLSATPAFAYYGAMPVSNGLSQVCDGRYDPNCLMKESDYAISSAYPYQPEDHQYPYNEQYQSYTPTYDYSYAAPTYEYSYPSYNTNYEYDYSPYEYSSYENSYSYQYQYGYTAPQYNYSYSY